MRTRIRTTIVGLAIRSKKASRRKSKSTPRVEARILKPSTKESTYYKAAEAHECSWTGGESARSKVLTPATPAGTLHVSTPEGGIVSPVRSVMPTPTNAHS